ncbi:MAG TPA: hypothetical protein VLC09_11945 [Polyangiaceae bacterium]|nr:hypothetical protein [Polyangiaceae bacterium]
MVDARGWLALGCAMSLQACLPQFFYAKDAAPVEKTVKLIESDARVAAALGEHPEVSLAISKTFERDFFKARFDGRDHVRLLTKVSGARGEAWLDLDAQNIDEQGWSGTFTVRTMGRQVLQGGSYVSVGAELVLSGEYAADGSPRVL